MLVLENLRTWLRCGGGDSVTVYGRCDSRKLTAVAVYLWPVDDRLGSRHTRLLRSGVKYWHSLLGPMVIKMRKTRMLQ